MSLILSLGPAAQYVDREVVKYVEVEVPANEHKDLLWGLQGAGSNFGIVTKLTMKLHPVDKVYGGMVINVAPSEARCKKVLTNWRDWILDAPRSVMSMAVLPCGAPVVPMAVCELDQVTVPQEAKAKCTANKLPSSPVAAERWAAPRILRISVQGLLPSSL